MLISIDPGASGGIAWRDEEGRIGADPMPEGMSEIFEYLDNWGMAKNVKCYLEKTGTYMPGNSGPAAATFARHCGHLEMALYALQIPTTSISPQKWMKTFTLPKDKAERKKAMKELMARRYPSLKVTMKTADALGLLTWAIEKGTP